MKPVTFLQTMVLVVGILSGTAGVGTIAAAPVNPLKNTFCNPLDLDYTFWGISNGQAYRECADPDLIMYKNEYYLFASHADGYWWSTDMRNWHLVIPTGLDLVKYAPGIVVVDSTMYYTSSEGGYMYKTSDPKAGVWTNIWSTSGASGADPCLFKDDDGKVYCYNGCGPTGSIGVKQFDPKNNMATLQSGITLISSDTMHHGFEVFGDNNLNTTNVASWFEASWMTKYNNKYYLEYSVPGTELRSYGNGCYVSQSPTGPFTFCTQSPTCFRPLGFVTGVGHTAAFKDTYGKYWHVACVVVATLNLDERRLAILPTQFDSAGLMHTDTYLGDFPQYLPGQAPADAKNNLAGAMLLSYTKSSSASSALSGHQGSNAFDENIKTWWSASTSNSGEWLLVDLGKTCEVEAIQTNFAEQDATYAGGRGTSFSHKFKIEGTNNTSGNWTMLVDKSTNTKDVPHDYSVLDSTVQVRYVRITNEGPMPGGGKFALRDFRIFGNGLCAAPGSVSNFTVARNAANTRVATLSWNTVADAEGYIIRFGIAADKLYNNYQIMGKSTTTYDIRSLNVGMTYYFAMDAYSGCGITQGAIVKRDDNTTETTIPEAAIKKCLPGNRTMTILGNRFVIPREYLGKQLTVALYDCSGKKIQTTIVKKDLSSILINSNKDGVYLVRIKE